MQYLAILMFLVILPMVVSRECYECKSTISFRDCDRNRRRVRCLYSQRCVTAKAYATSGIRDEGYVKGCAAHCSASTLSGCNDPNIKCEVKCCSSDYCNGASGPVISGLLLIVTTGFMYLFGF